MKNHTYIFAVAITCLMLADMHPVMGQPVTDSSSKPNFIILLTDDQGYQDLGCYGSPNIKTPRIDTMASQGIRFTNFYAQPVCGPSRKSILTGCYPLRTATSSLKERKTPHPGLASSEITVAEILKAQGYATAAYGKWDICLLYTSPSPRD